MSGYKARIDFPAMPKKRPIVTKNGTYMPRAYTEWKETVGWLMLAAAKGVKIKGRCSMMMAFDKDGFDLVIEEEPDGDRYGRSDIDNLCGAVMDAAQGVGLIRNDIDVVHLEGWMRGRTSDDDG